VILGIDGSNLRSGGSLTHLTNLLAVAEPAAVGIDRVVVWAWKGLLDRMPEREWLEVRHEPEFERPLPVRVWWQRFQLPRRAAGSCDLLFAPGGTAPHAFGPMVTMSRTMLPFEYDELFRYAVSPTPLRLLLLRFGQIRTFRRADGLIFLTEYAQRVIEQQIGSHPHTAVIPHGLEDRFRIPPRPARPIQACSPSDPLRLLYVSIVDTYKHQWHVAEAVAALRSEGLPIAIDFVGPDHSSSRRRFRTTLARLDPNGEFLRYCGPVSHRELPEVLGAAELFVFASSCENMPNSLLEAMGAGLPVACAERGPMPEVLADTGEYFDPENPDSIAAALRRLVNDVDLRTRCAQAAHERAEQYSWRRCASETFDFLRSVWETTGRAG